jgi:hypothetical protein
MNCDGEILPSNAVGVSGEGGKTGPVLRADSARRDGFEACDEFRAEA